MKKLGILVKKQLKWILFIIKDSHIRWSPLYLLQIGDLGLYESSDHGEP